jgi:multimeric flavodoxin WrbA
MTENVVVLDGTRPDEPRAAVFRALMDALGQTRAEVTVFPLREMKLAHCIGCLACWVETPGVCRYREAGAAIVQTVLQSDTTVLFTPVTFGGYSAQLKQVVDRWASLWLPYFRSERGEIHHVARYPRFPRLVALGTEARSNPTDARLFRLLVGRNAINFHAPSYAADVVTDEDDPATRGRIQALLSRHDRLPWGSEIRPLTPAADQGTEYRREARGRSRRRAVLIVGSPKTLSRSTSQVLGTYVLDGLRSRGWETESLTLRPSLLKGAGEASLLAPLDRADLVVLSFPVYVDALPYQMTRALEIIADHRLAVSVPRRPALVAIANNGFPESYQNYLALSICRRFAAAAGMSWAGGLAMGAGEAISGGEALMARSSLGARCEHVLAALDATVGALADGAVVPESAVSGIAHNSIPVAPLAIRRWISIRHAAHVWQARAAAHGVSRKDMLARPFEARGGHGLISTPGRSAR